MIKLMTPGPTQVRENVRKARSIETTNPDIDPGFYDEYKELCETIGEVLHTKNPVYIMSGEGILGLEAACASLTESGARVLVIDNGIYGAGFADFVTMYGGEPVLYTKSYDEPIEIKELEEFLEKDHDFKYATVVHHDTPTGMTNDVHAIGKLLDGYGIMSVVDSVSAMIGEELFVDAGKLDIVCGASQKAVSAPPGLTIVSVSSRALAAMKKRREPIASYYANLLVFENYYENQWFPYTMPISDIYGLKAAFDNIKAEPDIAARHYRLAKAVRGAIAKSGLKLYGKSGYSNLATVFYVPDGIDSAELLKVIAKEHGIMLTGSLGVFKDKLIRIGHMGENANAADIKLTLTALQKGLEKLGFNVHDNMNNVFSEYYNQ